MPDFLSPIGPFQAFLFDMDGTLLTSRAAIERVWNAWSLRWDLDAKEVSDFLHGRRATDAVDHFLPHLSSYQRTEEIEWVESRELNDTEGVVEVPGAATFLATIPVDRWAVVTSAARRLAICRIRAAGLPLPKILIAAEDVALGKPDPSGYCRAADLLGQRISDCVIFEDAPAGIRAGLASGARVAIIGNDPATATFPAMTRMENYVERRCEPSTDGWSIELRPISAQI